MNEKKWRINAVLGGIVAAAVLAGILWSGDCITRETVCSNTTHPCHLSCMVAGAIAAVAVILAGAQFATANKEIHLQRALSAGSVACFLLIIVTMMTLPGICTDPAAVCQSTQALAVPASVLGFFVTGIMLASTRF